jgi:hypothetical protein
MCVRYDTKIHQNTKHGKIGMTWTKIRVGNLQDTNKYMHDKSQESMKEITQEGLILILSRSKSCIIILTKSISIHMAKNTS